jgi:hypothetical protein
VCSKVGVEREVTAAIHETGSKMPLLSRLDLGHLPETGTLILYLTCLALGSLTSCSIYRLWFHPLRKIPGPKLAAVTHLYELYFDAIKGGRYLWEIEKLHEKYGEKPSSPNRQSRSLRGCMPW